MIGELVGVSRGDSRIAPTGIPRALASLVRAPFAERKGHEPPASLMSVIWARRVPLLLCKKGRVGLPDGVAAVYGDGGSGYEVGGV